MVCNIETFPYEEFRKIPIQRRGRGNPGSKHPRKYLDVVTAFDIEASTLPEIQQAVMYIWQWQIGNEWTVIGRTWAEFLDFVDRLQKLMPAETRMMVFVHNLSYEFQFLRGIWNFEADDVFAIKSRKILKCDLGRFEFRCSWIYSNMNLADFTKTRHVEHQKLSGEEFDYSIVRYPWTELSEQELQYCINDVQGLVEAIQYDLSYNHDNLYTIPMTSTGFVRRDAKRAMREVNHRWLTDQFPTYAEYRQLRETFRGGNCHASRLIAGKVISFETCGEKVYSYDRSSSYPDVIMHHKYPTGVWTHRPAVTEDEYRDLIRREKAVCFKLCMSDVELRDWWIPDPYIPQSKCAKLVGSVIDNGRVKRASYLEIYITDVDEEIIFDQYVCSGRAYVDVMFTRYGYLPESYRKLVIKYYKAKTELKGVDEDAYMRSKERLNSLYGMMAQDPCKQRIQFDIDPETGLKDFIEGDEDPGEILRKYYGKAFLTYQWGVWVTAWARWELWRCSRLAGGRLCYMDTDSVKLLGKLDLKEYNTEMRKRARKSGAYAKDPKGQIHYMGVFEEEGSYDEFATLGAKKYVYRQDGVLHVTIAGVTKKKGGAELEEHGGIQAFKEGFTFRKAGGTESVYNDYPPMDHIEIDGHGLPITSNVVIKDSEYTLGVTEEYRRLLNEDGLGLDSWTVEFVN